jgi:hypothetical protein
VQGNVGRNLSLAAMEAQLAAEVDGSVEARTGRLTLLPGGAGARQPGSTRAGAAGDLSPGPRARPRRLSPRGGGSPAPQPVELVLRLGAPVPLDLARGCGGDRALWVDRVAATLVHQAGLAMFLPHMPCPRPLVGGMGCTARSRARGFYATLAAMVVVGYLLNLVKAISPVKALFYSAVLNGIMAVSLIVVLLLVCNNCQIVGECCNGRVSNILGWLTDILMGAATGFMTWAMATGRGS